SMVVTASEEGFSGARFKNDFGNLWIRQEWDMHRPLIPGESYTATSRVPDIYEWRGRTVVKQEVTILTPDGEVAAQGRHHQSYLLTQSAGKVKLRDPKSKQGGRRFQVPPGEELKPVERTITLEMCGAYFHGDTNYHTDKKVAEELGFDDVVVGGRMTMSYLGEMMDKSFDKGWFEGGTLDIKFTNIVWPGDRVVAKGVITDRAKENGDTRAKVSLWMEKEDGTVVIVGIATALE
ncbi:MAG: MaoC/PaaZ C-terminal domain-containing protein, partial [Dehalococcoidia bacterium]